MIDFYNAFISYRHADPDMKVAEHVQRSLEHFHIPGNIQKKTGRKKIERIFRDKDELPITSDLTDTISNALEKAEYLIVICSPNTKESMWVKREIQFFLKNHSKNRVLTVLAGGEPQDVIPEELLCEERMVENELGMKYAVKVPIEPLSCDYRMPFKKADKEELPRLASALIGCSYDELVRRQRQYRMRRVTAIFGVAIAAALVFAGYMIYNNFRLDRAYKESLANQSRYLANESSKLFDEERRIEALQLALAALPSDDDDDRPVTAEAVRALTRATLAYRSLSGSSVAAVWNYQMSSDVKDFGVSDSGETLAACDGFGNVSVWNTGTRQQVFSINLQNVKSLDLLDDSTVFILTDTKGYAYDIDDGSKKWSVSEGDYRFDNVYCRRDDGKIVLVTGDHMVLLIDPEDGSEVSRCTINEREEDFILSFYDGALSPDGSKLVLAGFCGIDQSIVVKVDLNKGISTRIAESDDYIRDMGWGDDSHLLYSSAPLSSDSSQSYSNISIMRDTPVKIECVDPNTGRSIWNTDFVSSDVILNSMFLRLPEQHAICYSCANLAIIYNVADGSIIHKGNINNPIIDVSDVDGDGWPMYVSQNGGISFPTMTNVSDNAINCTYILANDLRRAVVNGGLYVNQHNSPNIIYYDSYVQDENWQDIDEDLVFSYYSTGNYVDEEILAYMCTIDGSVNIILVDPAEAELITTVDLGEGTFVSSYNMLGRADDHLYYVGSGIEGTILYELDIRSGEVEEIPLNDDYYVPKMAASLVDGKVCYPDESGNETLIRLYDTDKQRTTDFEIDEDDLDLNMPPRYLPGCGVIFVSTEDQNYIIDVESEDVTKVRLPDSRAPIVKAEECEYQQMLAITDNSNIYLLDREGELLNTIPCNGLVPQGFVFHGDENNNILYVAYNNGSLWRYNASTGEYVGNCEIETYEGYVFDASFEFDDDDHTIYVQIGMLTDIVDTQDWIELAYIENCLGHHPGSDRFFTTSFKSQSECHLGYFHHYTLQELKDMGNETLGDQQISQAMRDMYGI